MTVVRSLNNSGLKPFASERAMPSICQIAFVLLELCRWILIRLHGVLAHCQTHARPVFDDSDLRQSSRGLLQGFAPDGHVEFVHGLAVMSN